MAKVSVHLGAGLGVHHFEMAGRPKIVNEDGVMVLAEILGPDIHFVAAFPRERVVSVVVDEFRAAA